MITALSCQSPERPGRISGMTMTGGRAMGLVGAVMLMAACSVPTIRADVIEQGEPVSEQTANEPITLTGARLTQGNAVDCPTLRDDAGEVHTVSYLSPAVAIGARVTVTGSYGITTTCLGTVLVVKEERLLAN